MNDESASPPERAIAQNRDIAEAFAAALSARDAVKLVELISPDVVWRFPGRDHPLAGDHAGLAGVAAFAQNVAELTRGSFEMDIHDVYTSPTGAIIAFTGRGERPDGRTLDNPTRLVLRIADGQIQELWEFVWDGEAVAAFWR